RSILPGRGLWLLSSQLRSRVVLVIPGVRSIATCRPGVLRDNNKTGRDIQSDIPDAQTRTTYRSPHFAPSDPTATNCPEEVTATSFDPTIQPAPADLAPSPPPASTVRAPVTTRSTANASRPDPAILWSILFCP